MESFELESKYSLNQKFAGNRSSSSIVEKSFYQTNKGSLRIFFLCFSLVLWLPLTFLVIIPAIIMEILNATPFSLQYVTLFSPANTSFETEIAMSFAYDAPIPAYLHLNDVTATWNDPVGGHLIGLATSNTIKAEKHPIPLFSFAQVKDTNALANFVKYVLSAESCQWDLQGDVEVTAVVTTNIPLLKRTVTVLGFNNFTIPVNISAINVTDGTASYLFTEALAVVTSESSMGLVFGQNMNFVLKSDGIEVGVGAIANASLLQGVSTLPASVALVGKPMGTEEQFLQVMKVASNYSMGLPSTLTMDTFSLAHEVSWLSPGLSTMTLSAVLQGSQHPLVAHINISISTSVFDDPYRIPFQVEFYNSYDVSLTVESMESLIYWEGSEIAQVFAAGGDFESLYPFTPFTIPPRSHLLSPVEYAQPTVQGVVLLNELSSHKYVLLTIDCDHFKGTLGNFTIDLDYVQADVNSTVLCLDQQEPAVPLCYVPPTPEPTYAPTASAPTLSIRR